MRIAPPGRKSNSQTGLVNPWGPHHRATCFGSVHTLNTSSRGASNTRVSTNSCPSFAVKLVVATVFLLLLHVTQVIIETIKTFRPKLVVAPHPVRDVLERPGGKPAGPPLRLASARNQTGVLQRLEVP